MPGEEVEEAQGLQPGLDRVEELGEGEPAEVAIAVFACVRVVFFFCSENKRQRI